MRAMKLSTNAMTAVCHIPFVVVAVGVVCVCVCVCGFRFSTDRVVFTGEIQLYHHIILIFRLHTSVNHIRFTPFTLI